MCLMTHFDFVVKYVYAHEKKEMGFPIFGK